MAPILQLYSSDHKIKKKKYDKHFLNLAQIMNFVAVKTNLQMTS